MAEVGQSWSRERQESFCVLSDVTFEELAADFLTPMLAREWLRKEIPQRMRRELLSARGGGGYTFYAA
jgi:cell pole-organizing protein PopZ